VKIDPDEAWRINAANQISRHLPRSVRTVFDCDDAYGVAFVAMHGQKGKPRPWRYRCGMNAVTDALRSIAGYKGGKVLNTTSIPRDRDVDGDDEAQGNEAPIWEKGQIGPHQLSLAAAPAEEQPEQHLMGKTDLGPYFIAQVTDPKQRRCLELIFLEGVEFGKDNEAAKRLLGMSNASVSRLKHRALAEIKRLMELERK